MTETNSPRFGAWLTSPWGLFAALTVVLLTSLGGIAIVTLGRGRAAAARELAAVAAVGEPLTVSDLEAYYSPGPGEPNLADAWLAAFAAAKQQGGFHVPGVPIVSGESVSLESLFVDSSPPWLPVAKALLGERSNVLRELHSVAETPGNSFFPIIWKGHLNALIQHVQELRATARFLQLEGVVAIADGDAGAVVRAVESIHRAGDALRLEPLAVSQLVRLAIDRMASDLASAALGRVAFTSEQSQRLAKAFASRDYADGIERAFLGDRAIVVVAYRSPDGARALAEMNGDVNSRPRWLDPAWKVAARADLALFLETSRAIHAAAALPPARAIAEIRRVVAEVDAVVNANQFAQFQYTGAAAFGDYHERLVRRAAEAIARHRAVALALAMDQHVRRSGEPPNSLAELVGTSPPLDVTDPWTGEPLRWKRGAETMTIYSVGIDQTDDGGVENWDRGPQGEPDVAVEFRVSEPDSLRSSGAIDWLFIDWLFKEAIVRIKPWFRFSLASMLAIITIVAVWLAKTANDARKRSAAVAAIEALDGRVRLEPIWDAPAWLVGVLGEKLFFDAVSVDFAYGRGGARWRDKPEVTNEALESLTSLRSVTTLELGNCRRLSDACLTHLKYCKELTTLYLYSTGVQGAGLAEIAQLPRICSISLSRSKLTDVGLEHLAEMKGLTWLHLDQTEVTDEGLRHLARAPALEELTLAGTKISDAGLRRLASIKTLKSLSVARTSVTLEGVEFLRAALPKCRVTCDFGLGQTPVDGLLFPEGYSFSIDEINAKFQQLGIDGEVGAGDSQPGSPAVSFTMFGAKLSDVAVLALVNQMPELEVINIRAGLIGDEFLAGLPCSRLRFLSMQGTRVTDEGLKHLSKFENLNELILRETHISDAGLKHLEEIPNLDRVVLDSSLASDEARDDLADSMPECKVW